MRSVLDPLMWTPTKHYMHLVRFVSRVAQYQIMQGRYFVILNPCCSPFWSINLTVLSNHAVQGNTDLCAFGMKILFQRGRFKDQQELLITFNPVHLDQFIENVVTRLVTMVFTIIKIYLETFQELDLVSK